MKKAIVSVINDLATDQRVHKVCCTLVSLGYHVTLVGRVKKNSLSLADRSYTTVRFNLPIETGPLFYLIFNLRLFIYLLFKPSDILVSNDLDTLLPNYLVATIKKIPIVYDTHEIFTEVPELATSKIKKNTWLQIERFFVPKLKYMYTVNDSIARWYNKAYKVNPLVVRNIPVKKVITKTATRVDLQLPPSQFIIILQGSGINIQRGAEELIESMNYIDNALLLIVGDGDVIPSLTNEVAQNKNLTQKIKFIAKMPYEKMMQYTLNANLGLSLDKSTNLNYQLSLPNKLFDYIHAGIPVLVSRLPEVEAIVNQYDIGAFIENHNPVHIAFQIKAIMNNSEQWLRWKANTHIAAEQLTWQHEEQVLKKLYEQFI